MDTIEIMHYASIVLPLVWLAALALRPFLADMNRLLFIVIGMTIYGFFVKALVIPLTGAQDAQLAAVKTLVAKNVISSSDSTAQVGLGLFVYLGIALAIACLLMLWIQRVLARSPHASPDKSSADVNPGERRESDHCSPSSRA